MLQYTNKIQEVVRVSTKAEKAKELYKCGYNCSQAVFATFCEELGLNEDTALKISSSFGGGMGKMGEVCGAVTGMFMATGLKYGYTKPKTPQEKIDYYSFIRELAEKFKEKNGTILCKELLTPDKETGKIKKPCAEIVKDAAEIFEQILNEK